MAILLSGPPNDASQIGFTWFNWFKKLFTKVEYIDNNVNAIGNELTILQTSVGELSSGTYTPTYTNVANTSAGTPDVAQWTRVGNIVTVTGRSLITITSASTSTQVGISLPIASNFTDSNQCNGIVIRAQVSSDINGGTITGDTTNYWADLLWRSGTSTGSQNFSFMFQYEVL